jgi:hypothetical protein
MSMPATRMAGAVVAGVLWAVAFTQPVFAADTAHCSEIYTIRHSGLLFSGGTKSGVRGTLEGQGLNQCTGPGFPVEISGSFAWVNYQGTNEWDIVQIGIGRCRKPFASACDSNMQVIWAYGRDSNTPGCQLAQSRGPEPEPVQSWNGASHQFAVTSSGSTFRLFMDGSQKQQATICWTYKSMTWFAESWDAGDALGGTSSNHFRVSAMATQSLTTGTWSNTSFDPLSTCNLTAGIPYHCDIVSSNSFDTWTLR